MPAQVYGSGHGEKGSLSWTPHPEVTAALEQAFYLSFKTLTPTGKRFVIGMDVSGSMSCAAVTGMPHVTAREAVCAITMALVRAEGRENVRLMAFSSNFVEVQVRSREGLA
jgi:60 kDa SS-A/Ro ribonucleoprotein